MSARRQLIVSADDFGMSRGVNAAIMRAHREGVLTQVSLMVRGRAAAEAVELARSTPSLSVGLHLTLVQGYSAAPSGAVPLLAGADGRLRRDPVWAGMRYFFTPGARRQIEREVVAQLEAFAATGLQLSHVDGHLTIHMHPIVLGVLLDVATRYRIRAIRLSGDPLVPALRWDGRHLGRKLFEAGVFGGLSRWALPHVRRAGLRYPDRVYGMHQSGHVSEDYWSYLLPDLPPGVSEVYCHPAVLDDEAQQWRPAEYAGDAELTALCSPRLRAALDAAGIERISYRDLVEPRQKSGRNS
ncbi:MAG: hopanoid biosynthesis-associated protein HpnK [Candidatus Binatia bacterium]